MTSSEGDYLHIMAERRDALCILRIAGELDASRAETFADYLGTAVDAIPGPMLVDLAGLTFIDTAGAQALATAIHALQASRLVTVQSCPPLVRKVWGLVGLPRNLLPPVGRATPDCEIPVLVRQVQQARVDAREMKLVARWMMARLTDTCIRLAGTRERNELAVEQGRRTVASSRIAREYIRRSQPGATI